MSNIIVGIDLGTTNSLVGALIDGRANLFADDQGDELLPSIVGTAEDGTILVGRAARNRRLIDPDGTAVAVKRKMGTDAQLRVGSQRLSPQEVSALILAALLDRAEHALGERPARAIITVPALFDDAQRQATRDAGAIAGLAVERLINEPTAAAVTCQTGAEELVLVYDFGGGTFDVSLLDRDAGMLEVRRSRGDTQLGGGDIDRALVDAVLARTGSQRARIERDPRAMTRLDETVERAKIALSDRERARLFEPFLVGGDDPVSLDVVLERADVERVARPFVERTLACIDAALRDAGVTPRDLDRVLLVGGSSKMPCVQALVAEHLGRPVIADADADRAVALGATLLAARAAGLDVDEVLVDITPHTLAVGVFDNSIHRSDFSDDDLVSAPIIPRDTVIPAQRKHVFYTRFEDQPKVEVPIVQGEHRLVVANTLLGEICVEGLPPGPAHSPIEVAFKLDLSGVLDVSATHLPSGLSASVTIANSPSRLSEIRRDSARKHVEALRGAGDPDHTAPAVDPGLARALLARAARALDATSTESDAAHQVREAKNALEHALGADASDVAQRFDTLGDALLDLA